MNSTISIGEPWMWAAFIAFVLAMLVLDLFVFGGRQAHKLTFVDASGRLQPDFLHTNIGWLGEQESRRDRFTWGLGLETRLAQRTWLIAETFGQNQGRPQYQFGFRHRLAPDRAQIDATYGTVSAAARKNTGFPLACACSPHDFYLEEPT